MAIYFICQPDFKGNTLYFLALRKFSSYEIWLSLGFLTLRKFSSNEIWLSLGFLTLRKFFWLKMRKIAFCPLEGKEGNFTHFETKKFSKCQKS